MLTAEMRIHEAPSLPCMACGAALPVDPTAMHAWCPACHRWSAVAPEARRHAWEHQQATLRARAEQAAQHALAVEHEQKAREKQRAGRGLQVVLAFMLLSGALGGVPTVIFIAIGIAESLAEELEEWAALLVMIAGSLVGLALLAGGLGACWWFYKSLTRHKRRARKASDEWFRAMPQEAAAVCGVCGAPVAFRVGEHSVTCGFCRSVVLAGEPHAHRLIRIALAETQRARLVSAKAERQKLKAELSHKRTNVLFMTYMYAGSLALLALPVGAALYAWRTLSFSLEERLMQIAEELRAEFGAGLDTAFEWLDSYWLGDTPLDMTKHGVFQSQWSFEAVFHGRPVLVTVTSDWSDRTALYLVVLLARPRERDGRYLEHAPANARARARGFQLELSYAGIALSRTRVPARELTTELLTEVAQCAYELAEEREVRATAA